MENEFEGEVPEQDSMEGVAEIAEGSPHRGDDSIPEFPRGYNLQDPLGFPPEFKDSMTQSRERFEGWAAEEGLSEKQAHGLWNRWCESELQAFNDYELRRVEAQRQRESEQRDQLIEKAITSADGYHLTVEEAAAMLDKMRADTDGPYMNGSGKHSQNEHARAVALGNRLLQIMCGQAVSIEGYFAQHEKEKSQYVNSFGEIMDATRDLSSGGGERPWVSGQGGLPEDRRSNVIL